MILPNMGKIKSKHHSVHGAAGLADALFSTVQQRVLGLLFGQADRSFYTGELIQLVDAGSGAVQREIARLENSGLITMRRVGAQKHYQANTGSPLFEELRSITRKTVGLTDPLRVALTPLTKQISAAFVYGSVAKRRDAAASDIDLMVLSDSLAYSEIYSVLEPVSEQLGRTVNPTVYSVAEWSKRARSGNAFVIRVKAQPKIWIIGSENDLPA
jgi:predicted nucleotidyltransferase